MAVNIFELFGTIDADNKKANEAIDETTGKASKSSKIFGTLGKGVKVLGTGMAVAAGAAGAAAFGLSKKVVSAYADYEQLVGGVDTLFKDATDQVQQYAKEAFKTAGLSANDYMETVTGFSASLIQSLGGDTKKAAEVANQAVVDMSDNANKMGTDIGSIQNAYQGFAKQNYTMLDNLKLGYGGTKEEMQRLLDKANELNAENGKHTDYQIENFADIAEAIHVIQDDLDITGTTAKEGTETISGAIAGMGAAWQNLLAGMGDANADVGKLVNDLVEQFGYVVKNITPILGNIVTALPPLLDGIVKAIGDLLPTLLDAITELFSSVLQTLLDLLPKLMPVAVDALMTIVQTIVDNLPLLVYVAMQLISTLISGIGEALPELIPAAVQAIVMVVETLIGNMPMILDAALQLITGLGQGLLAALPILIEALPQIIMGIVSFFIEAIPQLIDAGIQLLTSLVTELPTIIDAIVEAIPYIITAVLAALNGAIPQLIDAGIKLFIALITNLPQIIITIVAAIPQIIVALVDGFLKYMGTMGKIGYKLVTGIKEKFTSIKWGDVGRNIISGIASGISSAADTLWKAAKSVLGNFKDGVKGFFGIHSPSKWGRNEIGKWIPLGIAGGIEDEGDSLQQAMDAISDKLTFDTSDLGADLNLDQVRMNEPNPATTYSNPSDDDKSSKSGDTFNIYLQALGELSYTQLMTMAKKLVTMIDELKNRDDSTVGGGAF